MSQGDVAGSAGKCLVCGSTQARETVATHLEACLDRATNASKSKPVDAFQIEVEGFSHTTGSLYWLHALARADATLFDLDEFLRDTWLEPCCGHMSSFEVGPIRFEAYPDDEFGPPAESMKATPLSEAVAPGKTFEYQYDFGSTTDLGLRVVARRAATFKGRAKLQLVAVNSAPALTCASCGKPATLGCAAGCEAEAALSCRSCAPKHECGEEMLSLIVNSPRTGVCGYPTEPFRKGQGAWLVAK